MNRVIEVDFTGQPRPFRMHENAYDALRAYLDGARARLAAEPDSTEVVDDLERSIGERLADLAGTSDRILTAADVTTVLEEVGTVEIGGVGSGPGAAGTGAFAGGAAGPTGSSWTQPPAGTGPPSGQSPRRRRRLYRIREGQDFAGVCTGLAAYSDIDLGWVRTIFVLAALVTAGAWLIVYLAMAFILPVVPTYQAWLDITAAADQP